MATWQKSSTWQKRGSKLVMGRAPGLGWCYSTQFTGPGLIPNSRYKERKQLFRNRGDATFREITAPDELGALSHPTVGRGLAIGDYDNDGRLDALVGNQNDPAELLRNRVENGNRWVSFLTIGTKSNRDGRHARFVLKAGGATQTAVVRAGSSYLSHSDRRVYFGLGSASAIDSVEIRWPSEACQLASTP